MKFALNRGKSPISIVFDCERLPHIRMFPPVAASAMKKYDITPHEVVASGNSISILFFFVAVVPVASDHVVVSLVTLTRAYPVLPAGSDTDEPVDSSFTVVDDNPI